ncbi:type VI secretion system-associated FHA domain protein TagH [Roseospira goensis]|uniref:Type VI secretion system FHA domain protein n=1 Tax=Roseospira goensis TaxID=391922 RepID=A0A7W6RZS4_9PROT|nr:type VI secretion system-associated FHA domain protein TagH [Roseospira goensis]MBB4286253.1 type VI secretion system FHA domain protein [Roseospira goensis]
MSAMLSLELVSSPPGGTPPGQTRGLESGSLTIGRGPDNDWILADPQRHLSKQHCEIAFTGSDFVLTDTSTNGVFINGAVAPVGRGSSVVLAQGDVMRLGEYELRAAIQDDVERVDVVDYARDASPWPEFEDRTYYGAGSGPQAGGAPGDPAAGPGGGAGGGLGGGAPGSLSPFDDGPADWNAEPIRPAKRAQPPATPSDHIPAEHDSMPMQRVMHQPAPKVLDESWDDDLDALLGDAPLQPGRAAPAPSGPQSRVASDAATVPPAAPDDLDALLGSDPLETGAPDAAADAPPEGAGAPREGTGEVGEIDDDLDAFLGAAPLEPRGQAPGGGAAPPPDAAPPATPPGPADRPDPFAAPEEPAPAPAAPAPAAPMSSPPRSAPTPAGETAGDVAGHVAGHAGALVAAFLKGAGLSRLPEGTSPDAVFETAGALLAVMTDGVRDLLAARATLKSEMRAEQTMIRAKGNNALKFSVDGREALERLLAPPGPAYLDGKAAAEEAFRDLRGHEMATMAGSSAAIRAVLSAFDPTALEAKLEDRHGLGRLLAGGRKARLWELYETHYRDLADEAADDFDSRFNREFRKAYETLVKDL